MDTKNLTIKEIRQLLDEKKISVLDLAEEYLTEIEKKNPSIFAYLEVFEDVKKKAEEAQNKIDAGQAQILTGIPLAIKDTIVIKGRRVSASSKILEDYISPYSATVIEKLEKAGVIFLGRTNCDEFAMGASTENSAYGLTRNPIDETRVPGGSSGGSAASVAMKGAIGALGSDTGGSIRQPAGLCGVVGLKPTYGAVSRYGLIAMASSLDCIGPFARTVEDAEIIFNQIKGLDPKDSTTVDIDKSFESPKKIGVPRKFLKEGIDQDILENFENGLEKLRKIGYEIVDVEIPELDYSLAIYYVICPAEVSSNMARYDGVKYGKQQEDQNLIQTYFKTRGHLLGPEVKRRIILGTYVLSAGYADEYYKKAWQARMQLKKGFSEVFKKVDALAMPTSPTPAFKIGEKSNDPLAMYLADIFTVSANLTGVPAISIPNGTTKREEKNLPVGFQLIAPHFGEQVLFEIGKKFEKIDS